MPGFSTLFQHLSFDIFLFNPFFFLNYHKKANSKNCQNYFQFDIVKYTHLFVEYSVYRLQLSVCTL